MKDRLLCSDTRVSIGQIWTVKDKVREYPAWVTGFVGGRVQIIEVCPPNVTATPTLAQRHLFNNTDDGYRLLEEVTC